MILLCLLISTIIESTVDSLEMELTRNPQLETVLALNMCYLKMGDYEHAIQLLKEYETTFTVNEIPGILSVLGDDYFFCGKMLEARETYLKLVARFPQSNIANDALERLSLIERVRKDTLSLKKLALAICLYETEQFNSAQESLKQLLKSAAGPYAYYYLALLYRKKDDLSLAVSALEELEHFFAEHEVHNATLLRAEINAQLNKKEEAQKILEDLIVKEPTSIYAVRARQMLGSNLDF